MEADLDHDGKISFEEFTKMVENTDVSMSMTLGTLHHVLFESFTISRATAADISILQTNSRQSPHSDTRRTKFARRFERNIGWLLGEASPKGNRLREKEQEHFICIHTACIRH